MPVFFTGLEDDASDVEGTDGGAGLGFFLVCGQVYASARDFEHVPGPVYA